MTFEKNVISQLKNERKLSSLDFMFKTHLVFVNFTLTSLLPSHHE